MKLDYGCIVYGSARSSYLKILEPIHNHALGLCLGAFRTSPTVSLCVQATEPPLALRRKKLVFTRESRMLRASLPSSCRPSVCPSVRPSVTLVSCIKTVQARITKSSPWTAPRSLVYRDKISCHWMQGFPSNEGVEEGYPPP